MNQKKLPSVERVSAWSFFLFIFFIALLVLIPRLDGFDYFPGKYLWAEDGVIFINESQTMGAAAIFEPYAGYLHFYPRIVAYFSSSMDLIYRPLVTLAGWVFAYLLLAYALAKGARALGFGWFSSVSLICLMSLQPTYGETFFNITNSQWMLGAALVILVLIYTEETQRQKIIKSILLIPLCLTGPFSIILVPVLVLILFLKKDWCINKTIYIVIFSCAVIQLLVLIKSGRATSGEISQMPWDWFLAFSQLLMFGANSITVLCTALLFWFLVIFSLTRNLFQPGFDRKKLLLPLLLIITAVIFIFASLYSSKQNPLAIAVLGGGDRYKWIPYVLIFFAALIASVENLKIHIIIIIVSGFICFKNFHHVSSPNLQFKSYTNYSRFQEVIIPINPQWATYPGWHIKVAPSRSTDEIDMRHVEISQDSIFTVEARADFVHDGMNLTSIGNDPIVLLKKPIFCKGSADLAVEINMTRHSEGWVQLFWSETGNFSEVDSIRRWYPAGSVKAQFAFPIPGGGAYIRFDPMEFVGAAKVQEIKVYCLQN